jgi:hypothetical protein
MTHSLTSRKASALFSPAASCCKLRSGAVKGLLEAHQTVADAQGANCMLLGYLLMLRHEMPGYVLQLSSQLRLGV